MTSQNDPEPSDFVFETHTNHNVFPPSDENEHGKPRIAPDILQFIVDQNEVDKQMLVVCFVSFLIEPISSVCGNITSKSHRTTESSGCFTSFD
jgi:hypothetical protein